MVSRCEVAIKLGQPISPNEDVVLHSWSTLSVSNAGIDSEIQYMPGHIFSLSENSANRFLKANVATYSQSVSLNIWLIDETYSSHFPWLYIITHWTSVLAEHFDISNKTPSLLFFLQSPCLFVSSFGLHSSILYFLRILTYIDLNVVLSSDVFQLPRQRMRSLLVCNLWNHVISDRQSLWKRKSLALGTWCKSYDQQVKVTLTTNFLWHSTLWKFSSLRELLRHKAQCTSRQTKDRFRFRWQSDNASAWIVWFQTPRNGIRN